MKLNYQDKLVMIGDSITDCGRKQPVGEGLLMTPFYIEPNREDLMRATMDEYGAVVRRLAVKHEVLFIDTQAAFDRVMASIYPATLAWDRVHPNMTDHAVLARAFLKAIGYQYETQ